MFAPVFNHSKLKWAMAKVCVKVVGLQNTCSRYVITVWFNPLISIKRKWMAIYAISILLNLSKWRNDSGRRLPLRATPTDLMARWRSPSKPLYARKDHIESISLVTSCWLICRHPLFALVENYFYTDSIFLLLSTQFWKSTALLVLIWTHYWCTESICVHIFKL